MTNKELQQKIEAVLFTHGDPLSTGRLASIVGEKKASVEAALGKLKIHLAETSALRILEKDGKVQMVTSKELAPVVEKLFRSKKQEELTRASLEVLAIVAYSGPTTREEIEIIRGVNSSYILRSLQMRGLITKDSSTNQAPTYEMSFEALRELGLKDPHDLPEWNSIQEKIDQAKHSLSSQSS